MATTPNIVSDLVMQTGDLGPSGMDQLNANLQNAINTNTVSSQNMFSSGLQSTPGMSPYLAAQAQGNYNAQAVQSGAANYDALSSRGNLQYQTFANEMDLQNKLAQQKIDVEHASSNAQFFGAAVGGIAALAAFSSHEDAQGNPKKVASEDKNLFLNPDYIEDTSQKQRLMEDLSPYSAGEAQAMADNTQAAFDSAGDALAAGASVFTRVPGSPGYENDNELIGTVTQALDENPHTAELLVKDPETGEPVAIDVTKAANFNLGISGDHHAKLKDDRADIDRILEHLGLPKRNAPKTDAEAIGNLSDSANEYSRQDQELSGAELEYVKAKEKEKDENQLRQIATAQQIQAENNAYTNRLAAIQQKYPTQSYQDIESNFTATQQCLKAFAFIAGGISQGLTGARTNPGVEAYNRTLDNMIKTTQMNYEKSVAMAQLQHGNTLEGLKTQYAISRDYTNMIDGQIKDMHSVIESSSSRLKNQLDVQKVIFTGYKSINELKLQRQDVATKQLAARSKYAATTEQQRADPLSVAIGIPGQPPFMRAVNQKSQETLNAQLPILNNQVNRFQDMLNELNGKDGLAALPRIASQFESEGYGQPGDLGKTNFQGKHEDFNDLYNSKGWFSAAVQVQSRKRLQSALEHKLATIKNYRGNLIAQNAYDYSGQTSNAPQTIGTGDLHTYEGDEEVDSEVYKKDFTRGLPTSMLNYADTGGELNAASWGLDDK